MELRRADRYPVQLECTVNPLQRRAIIMSGRTVNASRLGFLVSFYEAAASAQAPVVGDRVRLVLKLPEEPSSRPCSVDCLCQVVRVDGQTDAHLVAFELQRYQFRPSVPSAPQGPYPLYPRASGPIGPV